MEHNGIKINSLVDLISYYHPETLSELRAYYGHTKSNIELLTPGGIILGEEAKTDTQLYLQVAEKGLKAAKKRIQPNISRLRERLRNAKRLRVFGQVVAAITSVGLISALFSGWPKGATITTAFVNFAAVICSLIATNLESPLHGGAGNLIELYEMLVNVEVESEQLLLEFEILKKTSPSHELIMGKVSSANELASKLLKAEKLLWS